MKERLKTTVILLFSGLPCNSIYRFNRPPNQENSAPQKPWQPIPGA